MAARKKRDDTISDVLQVTTGTLEACILGTSPLVLNRMSQKARRELLMPRGRLTQAEKQTHLKHEPIREFNEAPYRIEDPKGKTLLAMPAIAIKKALCGAALDLPGATKSQLGRLTYVPGEWLEIYGEPRLYMAIVRSADMNKTPDVRTRVIVPEWACRVTVTFVEPLIKAQAIANLLAAGGITQGIGDGRQEKGTMSFGQFKLVDANNPQFTRIVKSWPRKAQLKAMENPTCYDAETEELLSWFHDELESRQKRGIAAVAGAGKTKEPKATETVA